MKIFLAAVAVASAFLVPTHARPGDPARGADTEEKRRLIERLFELTQAEESFKVALVAGFENSTGSALRNPALSEEQKGKMAAAFDEVVAMLLREMSWASVVPEMVAVYEARYSTGELAEINRRLDDPVLQKFFARQVELLPDTMRVGTEAAAKLEPQIKQIMIRNLTP